MPLKNMQCPRCNHPESHVYGSSMFGEARQRYRQCLQCGHRWKSYEEGARPVRSTSASQKPDRDAADDQLSIFHILGEDWLDE